MEEAADHCGDVRDQCIGDVEAIEDAHLLLRERTEEMLPPGGGGVSLQHPSNLAACFPQFRIARAVRVRAEHHPATAVEQALDDRRPGSQDRKSTRLNSSHV